MSELIESVYRDFDGRTAWPVPVREKLMPKVFLSNGAGFMSGSYPDGTTTVEGVPTSATVRVLLRSTDPDLDGLLISEVQSASDGTWRVDGLNPNLKYDVVGRKSGHNDVIMANVSPTPTDSLGMVDELEIDNG